MRKIRTMFFIRFRLGILWTLIFTLLLQSVTGQTDPDRPNVLLIFVDDLNTYVGAMGHPNAITPNLDKLAMDGVVFTDAHCQAPICGPSRASIMLGLRPSTTGIYGHIKDADIRTASEMTRYTDYLPEYFGKHGYRTMGVGKLFHQHAPEGAFVESGGRVNGFGPKPPNGRFFVWNEEGTSTDWGAYPDRDEEMPDTGSADWAIERLQKSYEQPFFMGVGFLRPHVPWYVPQKWFDKYNGIPIETPAWRADDFEDIPAIAREIDNLPMMPSTQWAIDNGEWENIIRAYLACVTYVDAQVGRVLDALESSAYAENTIVVLLSDHGYRLGEKGTFAKNCLWEEATRVPLIISGPGILSGEKRNSPVELLDIYPTLTDIAGLPTNPLNEGRSLASELRQSYTEEGSIAVTTYGRNNHAIRTRQYAYIRYEDGSEELYDRERDPHAFKNLSKEASMASTLQSLRKYLPQFNRAWSPASRNEWPQYIVEQRENQLAEVDFNLTELLHYCLHQVRRTLEDIPSADRVPFNIPHGEYHWKTKPAGKWAWTNGFWPGILWNIADYAKDPEIASMAAETTRALEDILDEPPRSHDLGFIFQTSFGIAYRMTGDSYYRDILLRAADSLMALFNEPSGTFLAWPSKVKNGEYAPHNTIIDSMLNMEMLLNASNITGDRSYADAAISHANQTMRNHIRQDYSTCHVVVYDDKTGAVIRKTTHQGMADSSTWSRGQAWGIYGFAMFYRETKDPVYLITAKALADYFIEGLPADGVPYWDFDDPNIPSAPRDASAAAIAASGMLDIAKNCPDPSDAARYLNAAVGLIEALSKQPYRTFSDMLSFLNHSTGSFPRNRELDMPIIYADYYFLEALHRLRRYSLQSAKTPPAIE